MLAATRLAVAPIPLARLAPIWHRLLIVLVVIVLTVLISQLVDRALARHKLDPAAITRYRVLRRSIRSGIVFIGMLSALLVIPQVRAVAGGILASSAIAGVVLGFAARSTIANVISGVMIAFTQPLRLGDVIEVDGDQGVVEEIDLIYTFIRLNDGSRLVIPNEKLASDTIRNSTIRRSETVAEISVQVPLVLDLEQVVRDLRELLADESDLEVFVSDLGEKATLEIRSSMPNALGAETKARELRSTVHAHLRERGVFA
jgi:small-conductance mechanosensitive channel